MTPSLIFFQCEKLDWKPNNVMEKVNLNFRGDLRGQGTIRTFSCKSTKSAGTKNGSFLFDLILGADNPWDDFGFDFDFGRNILGVEYACTRE